MDRIIYPYLYNNNEIDFSTGGLGILEPTSCIVIEVRNGEYELEMDLPKTSVNFSEVKIGRLILAPHFPVIYEDISLLDWQPFEIYAIEHGTEQTIRIRAWHVSYRLSKVAVLPCTLSDVYPSDPFLYSTHYPDTTGFSFSDDFNGTALSTFEIARETTLRSLIGGEEGSILSTWGGELEWDRFAVYLHTSNSRGEDTEYTVQYGQNMTGLTRQQTGEDVVTAVAPFWRGKDANDQEVIVTLPEGGLSSSDMSGVYAQTLAVPLDMSDSFQYQPTVSQLRTAAQSWLNANKTTALPENIDVSFINNPELESNGTDLLKLCDTVTVQYAELNLLYKAKVTKTVYNMLKNRYDEISISTNPDNLNKAIRQVVSR
jgi:phage minor structural protein